MRSLVHDCHSAAARLKNALGKMLSWYELCLPYFPGKWRTVNWALSISGPLSSGQQIVERRGLFWELDLQCPIQRSLYYLGVNGEEWRETEFIERIIQRSWCVIDVGANFGYYSLLAAKKVGPLGLVYAFEPSPPVYQQLIRNIELNDLQQIHAVQSALGDIQERGFIRLTSRRFQGQQGLCVKGATQTEQITVTTLDCFLRTVHCPRIDLVKVDIEGYEPNFLKGARDAIHEFKPLLMFECNSRALARYDYKPKDLLLVIKSFNYEVFNLHRGTLKKLDTLPRARKEFVNLFALPKNGGERFGLHLDRFLQKA